jgi:hypothetical protein
MANGSALSLAAFPAHTRAATVSSMNSDRPNELSQSNSKKLASFRQLECPGNSIYFRTLAHQSTIGSSTRYPI